MKVIKDLDIATIEAMHDELFDLGKIKIDDNRHKNYIDLIRRMYDSELYEKNKNIKSKNILEDANDLIFINTREKEYGNFSESMAKSARIATELTNKDITTEDFFKCMIALKLARLAYNTKYDTILDGIGYLAGLEDFLKDKKEDNHMLDAFRYSFNIVQDNLKNKEDE
jgi:hypothetical protein